MSKSSKVGELKTRENKIEKEADNMEKQENFETPISETFTLIRPSVGVKKQKITSIYPYKDEEGTILYEIVRQREGQPYICRRPTEDGKYEYSIKGVRKVIYNLPKVLEAIKNKEVIFITEGESKCDTLSDLNIVGTTAPFMLPNKWNSSYNKFLDGAKGVIIIQDDDQNGINFANNTYTTLREIFPEEKIGIMPISAICPNINKQGADITDIREYIRNDEKLKLILESIASQL